MTEYEMYEREYRKFRNFWIGVCSVVAIELAVILWSIT